MLLNHHVGWLHVDLTINCHQYPQPSLLTHDILGICDTITLFFVQWGDGWTTAHRPHTLGMVSHCTKIEWGRWGPKFGFFCREYKDLGWWMVSRRPTPNPHSTRLLEALLGICTVMATTNVDETQSTESFPFCNFRSFIFCVNFFFPKLFSI